MRYYKIQSKHNIFLYVYTSYFPYDAQNGNRSSKSNDLTMFYCNIFNRFNKSNDFQYNVLL